MPFVAPRISYNNSPVRHVEAPTNRPPWLRGPAPSSNDQQGSNGASTFIAPWRKNNRRSNDDATNNSLITTPTPPATLEQPQPSIQATNVDVPTKTSKINISLKSVKKPELTSDPRKSSPAPVFHQVGKVVPIPIVLQQDTDTGSSASPALTTVIPIQKSSQLDSAETTSFCSKMPKATTSACGPVPPPAPPPPPGAPPPPPVPPAEVKQVRIDLLRKAPKKRPDWAGMMKEIEKGRVLNHVQCNDRSKPMLTKLKSRGRFVYESEAKPATKSDAIHNRILNEIQQGVKLKKVHCNDRSKPILLGLRVRRQSSVMEADGLENAIAPSQDPVNQLAFLDIDDLRDELQSAKQLLETEVESKRNLERKARDQKCHIIAMEAEIETLKAKLGIIPQEEVSVLAKSLEKSDSKTFKHLRKSGSSLWKSSSMAGIKKSKSGLAKHSPSDATVNKLEQQNEDELNEMNEYDEEIVSLKEAVQHAKKQADEMEANYKEAARKLESVQNDLEESERKRKDLDRQLSMLQAQQDVNRPVVPTVQVAERTTQTEEQILEKTANLARQQSTTSNAGDYDDSDDDEESDMEVDEESVQKKKQERELKLWENKVKSVKDKQNTSRLERRNLKNLQKKLEQELKEANKRHKKLQKEVDKMAKMLKDVDKEADSDDEEEEEEDAEEEEETEEEESEEEEEESDSDDEEEDESSDEDDENGTYEDRLAIFGKRVKKRENVLNALRKGNYLLRANIDRLKDDLEEERIAYHDLEHELNSVVEEM